MVEISHLKDILSTLRISARKIDLTPLAGDASNRKYYRVSWEESAPPQSLILMVMADPEPFKASEEAVTGAPSTITELPFINIQRHLQACGVAVPEMIHYAPDVGWMLLEDMGDTLLAHEVTRQRANREAVSHLYQKALDELIKIQHQATPRTKMPCLAHDRAFDQSLLMWEFDHFIEYGIEARGEFSIPDKKKQAIRAYFSDIALRLATQPQVFTHRDYHSRNLMIQNGRIRVIDFQDALMGPCQYDLASLLRDAYIDLPDEVIDTLIAYYLARWQETGGGTLPKEMFREFFDLMSIQRMLKAAGRFVYIDRVKKNSAFLPYIPNVLARVKNIMERINRLKPLRDLLSPYVPELQ